MQTLWSGAGLGGGLQEQKNPNVLCSVGLSRCVGMVEPTGAWGLGRSVVVLLFAISGTVFFGISEITVILGVTCGTRPSRYHCSVGGHLFAAVPWWSWRWDSPTAGAVPGAWAVLPLPVNPRASSGQFLCTHIPQVAVEMIVV